MTTDGATHEERRIGVYGGTFNPIHLGHLRAAREVAAALDLERVIFIPSAQPPHKAESDQDPLAPALDRLDWIESAIAGEPLFEVDDLELNRSGASYSIHSLRTLRRELAPRRLVFILGQDAFAEMGSWFEPEAVLALVDIAVVSRPPIYLGHLAEWLPEFAQKLFDLSEDGSSGIHRETGTRIDLVEIDALDISASQIRCDIRAGRSVEKHLPDPVYRAITAKGCYTKGSLL
jgi:nicotinate-nucleotide adenylyltransferase